MLNVITVGKCIRDSRKAQGLIQEQLSALCGVGIRFIREVKQGKETCQFGKVLLLINMLGLDLIIAKRKEL